MSIQSLTPHQLEMLRMIHCGASNATIGQLLNYSKKSIDRLTASLYDTLGLPTGPHRRVLAAILYERYSRPAVQKNGETTK